MTSYLAHFAKASSRNLVKSVFHRFRWLDVYFRMEDACFKSHCRVPHQARSLSQQVGAFVRALPGHLLLMEMGGYWVTVRNGCEDPVLEGLPSRIPKVGLESWMERLKTSESPVAWIRETGRRITRIAERRLSCLWVRDDPGMSLRVEPRTPKVEGRKER